ncbi:hypothetical protein QS257_18290 [Terrilactibacillus sp. S3-3]|nr:hypothetical protein QS257_18290 [Terrilactibacillus sp. S3-3]
MSNVLSQINEHYLEWIIEKINNIFKLQISEEERTFYFSDQLNQLMIALVSELLGRGWSIQGLYSLLFKDVKEKMINKDFWDKFFERISSEKKTYICFFFPFVEKPSEDSMEFMKKMKFDILKGDEILATYALTGLQDHISKKKVSIC